MIRMILGTNSTTQILNSEIIHQKCPKVKNLMKQTHKGETLDHQIL